MKTATVTEAKNRLSALLDQVRAGESFLILDRGIPVARIEPAVAHRDPTGRLRRLERSGVVRAGTASPPLDLIAAPLPTSVGGASAVEALLEERHSAR